MFGTEESDLDTSESQPPSASRARHALQKVIHDITKEVSALPA